MKSLLEPTAVQEVRLRMSELYPNSQRLWGKMNAHQMVCHLADSYEVGLGIRNAGIVGTPLPTAVMKWFAFRIPMKWPRGTPTTTVVEQGRGGTPPTNWKTDYQRLLKTFETFHAKRDRWPLHPLFREMSTGEWMRWGYLHADHHLRQFGV